MRRRVEPAARLRGTVRVPGDKSVSHRALILNAVAEGRARISNLSAGADVASTAACLRSLGVAVTEESVAGAGLDGLQPAPGPLDCGNSGTTMRLLSGLLATRAFESVLTGDASLSRRPMERVAGPLRRLGLRADAGPPLRVGGGGPGVGCEIRLEVASAQVKSALLLAGLGCAGRTAVVEPARTRDHTERMLRAMGGRVAVDGLRVSIEPGPLTAVDVVVPGDLSAAAFWLVAATIHPDAEIELPGVGVNESRAALLQALAGAGAAIERGGTAGEVEPATDLRVVSAASLSALEIGPGLAADMIDELPVLAVLAALVKGESRITGARELRVKESDRVAAMAAGLTAMGADVEELEDGWLIRGGRPLQGALVRSQGDHRVAMALAVAALVAAGETAIEGAECVAISYRSFWEDLERLCRA